MHRTFTYINLALVVLAMSGCATLPATNSIQPVEQSTKAHLGKELSIIKNEQDQTLANQHIQQLLQGELSVDDAVQLALFNNKNLQATLYEVGISEADLAQASSLPNPRFSMLYAKNRDQYKIEQSITFNILSLFTRSLAKQVGEQQLAQTQQMVTLEVLKLAAETRKAYFNSIAAEQAVVYMQQVQDAAESSASLAKEMTKAGNFSQRDQMREQLFYAQAMAEYQRAQQASVEAREQLARLLGLADDTTIKLPNRLPNLPTEIPSQFAQQSEVEALAMKQRLDLQAMQQATQVLAKRLGLTKTTRLINVLEVGPARVLEGGRNDSYKNGVDISVELPIFDFGEAKVARAEAIYMQAVNRLAAQAVNARSQVRLAYRNYRSQYVLAKQYQDEIIPLRKRMADESLLRYNGMLISVFELLQDAQLQVSTTNQYIQTLRDYWVATSDLEMAMMGNPIDGASSSQKEASSW